MARQGHAFANADEVRVARLHQKLGHEHLHSGDRGDVVEDVPDDGETVGEVVVRGNIVMKEVGASCPILVTLGDRLCGALVGLRGLVRTNKVHSASELTSD